MLDDRFLGNKLGPSAHYQTIIFLEKLKYLGFQSAMEAGFSISLEDLKIPSSKSALLLTAEQNVFDDYLTTIEISQRVLEIWNRTSDQLKQQVIQSFQISDFFNPVYMMAFSGARGNISQIRQLVAMRGLMADPLGQIIDFPIRSNFREGLTLTEYLICCSGARKGIVDTALRTASSGYLTRRLVDVAHHVVISQIDCETNQSILLEDLYDHNKKILSLRQRLVGRILAQTVTDTNGFRIGHKNQEISKNLSQNLCQFHSQILIRSPLTCESAQFVCQLCYGWNLAEGQLVSIGEAVGVLAAQSIGEPGTQLTLRTFHTGGVFTGSLIDQTYSPFSGIVDYPFPCSGLLIRTQRGQIAFLSQKRAVLKIHPPTSSRKQICSFQFQAFTLFYVSQAQFVYKNQLLAEAGPSETSKASIDFNLDNQNFIENEQHILCYCSGELYFENLVFVEKNMDLFSYQIQNKIIQGVGEFWILFGQLFLTYSLPHRFQKLDLINKQVAFFQIQIQSHFSLRGRPSRSGWPEARFGRPDPHLVFQIKSYKFLIDFIFFKKFGYFYGCFQKGALRTLHSWMAGIHLQSKYNQRIQHKKFLNLSVHNFQKHRWTRSDPLFCCRTEDDLGAKRTFNRQACYLVKKSFWAAGGGNPKPQGRVPSGSFRQKATLANNNNFKKARPHGQASQTNYQLGWNCFFLIHILMVRFNPRFETFFIHPIVNILKLSDLGLNKPKGKKRALNDEEGARFALAGLSQGGPSPLEAETFVKQRFALARPGQSLCDPFYFDSFFQGRSAPSFLFLESGLWQPPFQRVSKYVTKQNRGERASRYIYHPKKPSLWRFQFNEHNIKKINVSDGFNFVGYLNSINSIHLSAKSALLSNSQNLQFTMSTLKMIPQFQTHKLISRQVFKNSGPPWGSNLARPTRSRWGCSTSPPQNLIRFFTLIQIGEVVDLIRAPLGLGISNIPNIVLTGFEHLFSYKLTKIQKFILGSLFQKNLLNNKGATVTHPGQFIAQTQKSILFRGASVHLLNNQSIIHYDHGEIVNKDQPICTVFYNQSKTGDIVQGIPKIEQIFEARKISKYRSSPKERALASLTRPFSDFETKMKIYLKNVQKSVLNNIQRIYCGQGIHISDKHIEIIVRQITSNVLIIDPGQTGLLCGEIVQFQWVRRINSVLLSNQILYEPLLMGMTKTCLETSSFISAASFQETIRILSQAAFQNQIDFLRGLKQNVIFGNIIPAGTGY
uniref:DNA-directed RNA polymerase n=1 Tax=Caulerpa cliftonii TaxID=1004391 RepID=A0A1C9JBL5_9CHLO|nr:RNA polymerase b2-subunit [Caulerpa cliftonii]AOP19231.1 RNA polymerase b2-subunit [Caulerpa cliftonii]